MFYHNINPVLFKWGIIEIRYYGLFYAVGFIIAYFLIIYLAKRRGLGISKEDASDFTLYSVFGGVLGARIFYVIFYNPAFYLANPLEIIAIWHGGLSFHGGMAGVLVSSYLFCKKKKIDYYEMADIVILPVALALALGRMANFINGELFGRLANVGWCIDYSKSQFIQDIPSGCRHPSQIYSSLKNIFIFGVLWSIKDRNLPKGFVFWSFVAMYGALRTAVEFFRQPDSQLGFIFSYFTMGQLLSFPMFLIGAYMLYRISLKKN
jgi:phosphatidylglycerol:prolipoprotein diacylglycerol transferase